MVKSFGVGLMQSARGECVGRSESEHERHVRRATRTGGLQSCFARLNGGGARKVLRAAKTHGVTAFLV